AGDESRVRAVASEERVRDGAGDVAEPGEAVANDGSVDGVWAVTLRRRRACPRQLIVPLIFPGPRRALGNRCHEASGRRPANTFIQPQSACPSARRSKNAPRSWTPRTAVSHSTQRRPCCSQRPTHVLHTNAPLRSGARSAWLRGTFSPQKPQIFLPRPNMISS